MIATADFNVMREDRIVATGIRFAGAMVRDLDRQQMRIRLLSHRWGLPHVVLDCLWIAAAEGAGEKIDHQYAFPPAFARFSSLWSARARLNLFFSISAPATSRPMLAAVSRMRMMQSANSTSMPGR